MEIRFKLFGFTDIIKENEVIITLPRDSSLQQAMRRLVEKYGEPLRQRLLKDDTHLQDYVRCVVAERIVDKLDERLEAGATIFILHEIAGGAQGEGIVEWGTAGCS